MVLGGNNIITNSTANCVFFFKALLNIALGMDRCYRYRKGCRTASSGVVTLFDRFPLPEVYEFMDGPRQSDPGKKNLLFMTRIEEKLYSAITRPDHIIMLHVSPEISLERKPDHNPNVIYAKCKALNENFKDDEPDITHVDADRSLDEVLLTVRQTLWSLL